MASGHSKILVILQIKQIIVIAQEYMGRYIFTVASSIFIRVIYKHIMQHLTNIYLRYLIPFGLQYAHICKSLEYKYILQNTYWKSQLNCSTNFLNKSPTNYSIENLRHCPTNCVRIFFRIWFRFIAIFMTRCCSWSCSFSIM